MIRQLSWGVLAACLLLPQGQPVRAADLGGVPPEKQPTVEKLDDGRLRIGRILVDRSTQSFTLPGTLIRLEPPLEYIAVTKGGFKAYESLLELEANAFEFNLACILIGLDAEGSTRLQYQFDTQPVQGMEVAIRVSWKQDGQSMEMPVARLLSDESELIEASVWVYIGSSFDGDTYRADQVGTLIGFVHDPASVIEHQKGLGIGAYGAVQANPAVAPAIGTPITLTISVIGIR